MDAPPCECGCGERVAPRKREGWKRYVPGHHRRANHGWDVDESGCWNWRGFIDDGYGRIWRAGRAQLAHRYYWEQENGPVPEGLQLDHLCRNRACVNPGHLEPVEQVENVRRGLRAKLNVEQVREIKRRLAAGDGLTVIGRDYGVGKTTISEIKRGRTWVGV